MSKFYIGAQKDEPITEVVWVNRKGMEEYIGLNSTYIEISDEDGDVIGIYKEDIPKLEAALAKARELGWFE